MKVCLGAEIGCKVKKKKGNSQIFVVFFSKRVEKRGSDIKKVY